MRRLRWRLARLFAPEPIIRDPLPGYVGAFIVMRYEGGAVATIKAATLDVRLDTKPPKFAASLVSADPVFRPTRTTGQVSDTDGLTTEGLGCDEG